MNFIFFFCGLLFYLHFQIDQCYSKSITFFNTEHPVIEWFDRRYFRNITVLCRRISRQDPRHYVEVYAHTLFILNNSIKMDFYFYQFLTNRYRPSFVEMHFKFCDMMDSDFFGPTIRNALGGRPCPYPAGVYVLKNMSIPYVPKGFPFTKGRIYLNVSLTSGAVTEMIGSGSIDMEVKVLKLRNN